VNAVDGVSFAINEGKTFGIVGESGSGKSTLARTVVGFKDARSGQILLEGQDMALLSRRDVRSQRRRIQLVVQDPQGALDPRMRIGSILAEPMALARSGDRRSRRLRATELLAEVGLPPRLIDAYPRQLSGGQCQRVGIARALAMNPRLLICDEVVSALDASVQAHILNLLLRLQTKEGFAMMFISHDLAVTAHMSNDVAVMYAGKFVEISSSERFRSGPLHPYSQALAAAGSSGRDTETFLDGEPPSPAQPPPGCRFHPRCPLFERLHKPSVCTEVEPLLREGPAEDVACHFA
jgi:oligopeptide/dipeptide ABC transporter ATP-binding protein